MEFIVNSRHHDAHVLPRSWARLVPWVLPLHLHRTIFEAHEGDVFHAVRLEEHQVPPIQAVDA